MPSCVRFCMVHVILSLPSFGPHFAICEMSAEGGQCQYHMNHAKMDAGGHKEGKKDGKKRGQKRGQKKGQKKRAKKEGNISQLQKYLKKRIKII